MLKTITVDTEAGSVDAVSLGREFATVVERIQVALQTEGGAEVDVAERAVDACARGLRIGTVDRHDWVSALEAYEQACLGASRLPERAPSLAA